MFGDFTTESPKHPSRAHRSSDTTNSTLSFSAAGADRLAHNATANEITTNLAKKTVRFILAVLIVEAHNSCRSAFPRLTNFDRTRAHFSKASRDHIGPYQ